MIKYIAALCFVTSAAAIQYVDFDSAMQSERYKSCLEKPINRQLYDFFKVIYQREQYQPSYKTMIPHIIHHVWFGNPLSDAFKALRQTWLDYHKDWLHILWTDRVENDLYATVVKSFSELNTVLAEGIEKRIVVLVQNLEFGNKSHFDAARNYGQRSDIIKWEVVHRYGGVYIDCDFECYKSLDALHATYDFYTCLQPLDTNMVQLGAALFAARPNHPILHECVTTMNFDPGPIVVRTGPIHFTNALIRVIMRSDGKNMIFPARYFYPQGYEERDMPEEQWSCSYAFANHHWAGSWLKPEAVVGKE